jgi:hypothetical protein
VSFCDTISLVLFLARNASLDSQVAENNRRVTLWVPANPTTDENHPMGNRLATRLSYFASDAGSAAAASDGT